MRATGFLTGTVALGLLIAGSLAAQQAAAPKDATGQCTDSTYTTAKTQARACLKHGGVKTWFAAAPAAPAPSASAPTSAPTKSTAGKSTADKSQPKDATGQCTDGSYTTAKTQARGCLKHGGVKTWFGGSDVSASAPVAPAAAPSPTAPTVVKAAGSSARATAPGTTPAQAPSNPTDVWVNLSTKAYHCPGTKYYGATKHGKYMPEADAKAAGFHPSYGKACS
jgi:hypothetical protein